MAISKVVGGNGFKGALSYIMSKPEASHITQSGVFSSTPHEIALEMRLNANQKSIKSPVMHCSLSLEPGEQATPEQLRVLGETWLREMGFDLNKTQYSITRHTDRDHDHIHILANRVMLDGKVLSTSHERRRSHEATRVAEKAAGLSLYEKTQSKSRGTVHDLRQAVDQALEMADGSLERFKHELEAQGLKLIENRSKTTGRLSGVSYQKSGGRIFKGSELGKSYSPSGLQKRGLDLSHREIDGEEILTTYDYLRQDLRDAATDDDKHRVIERYMQDSEMGRRAVEWYKKDLSDEIPRIPQVDDMRKFMQIEEWDDRLRAIIDHAKSESANVPSREGLDMYKARLDVLDRVLSRFDVDLKVYEGRGVGYVFENRFILGNELGKDYSGVGLQKAGHDIGIDLVELERGGRSPEDRLSDEFKAMLDKLGRSSEGGSMGASMDDDVDKFIRFKLVKGLTQGQKDRLKKDRAHEM